MKTYTYFIFYFILQTKNVGFYGANEDAGSGFVSLATGTLVWNRIPHLLPGQWQWEMALS